MRKILIAKDDVTLRQSLQKVLESINDLVFEAGNSEEAITLFKNEGTYRCYYAYKIGNRNIY